MDEPRIPTKKQQSWGALLSIVVIMLMIIGGAFYAWRERLAQVRELQSLSEIPDTGTATTTP